MLPSLDLTATIQNNALSGHVNVLPVPPVPGSGQLPRPRDPGMVDPLFIGGYGTVMSQLLSRNFPDYGVGVQLTIPIWNRAAQADMTRDQMALRQQEIRRRQLENQIEVDVENALTAVEQAMARYRAALQFRTYQEQTLEAERARYELGASTSFFVIQAQRDLAQARSTEIAALTAFNKARSEMDRATGQTIAANNIVIEEAVHGKVARPPDLPPVLEGR